MASSVRDNKSVQKICIIQKSRYFNPRWYRSTYEIKETDTFLLAKHYLEQGWQKGYNPSMRFSTRDYINFYRDIASAKVNPLLHYEQFGKKEGRLRFPATNPTVVPKRHCSIWPWPAILRLIAAIKNRNCISEQKNTPFLVYLHCPNNSCWRLLKSYIKNMLRFRVFFIIACPSASLLEHIQKWCASLKLENRTLKTIPDEVPLTSFCKALRDVQLDAYKVVFRITMEENLEKPVLRHDYIYVGDEWNHMCCEGVSGVYNIYRALSELNGNNNIGAITGNELFVADENDEIRLKVRKIADRYDIPVLNHYLYAAGGTFAIRSELLKQFLPNMPADFSADEAECFERLMTAHFELKGFRIGSLPTKQPKRYIERTYMDFNN